MFLTLLDLIPKAFWKGTCILFSLLSLGVGAVWLQSSQPSSSIPEPSTRQRMVRTDLTSQIQAHLLLRRRSFLNTAPFVHQTRSSFWFMQNPHIRLVSLYRKGLVFCSGKHIHALCVYDTDLNGLSRFDRYGRTHIPPGLPLGLLSLQKHWKDRNYIQQEQIHKRYKQASIAAQKAYHADLQHLKRIRTLRGHSTFSFTAHHKELKSSFWKKPLIHVQVRIQKSRNFRDTSLSLVYTLYRKKYGCDRRLWTLWKSKCTGYEKLQYILWDQGYPGLNAQDGDRIYTRTVRDGYTIQTKLNIDFRHGTIQQRIRWRRIYRQGILHASTKLKRPTTKNSLVTQP